MVIAGSRSHDLNSPEWQAAAALARAGGTLVVLMGLARLQAIAEQLISGGCEPNLPIAVISNGTYLIQDCRVGTLADISQKLVGVKAPATIVIGEVVSLRNRVQWMELAARFGP
jgi:uroporphyrinogen III methyltransferase/synthase